MSGADDLRESGNLALDFVNTERRSRAGRVDLIGSAEFFVAWFERATGPLDAAPLLPSGRTLAAEASTLRSEIRSLFDAVSSGEAIKGETLFTLNRAIGFGGRSTRLVVLEGALRVDTVDETDSPLALLAPIARAAAELVAHADPARLRRCAAEGCCAWFLDTSKGGQRRWCSMARCGNRSKAARYRARHEGVD